MKETLRAKRIFETVLYASDLAESVRFYHEVIGLDVISQTGLYAAMRCGDGVLLLFDPKKSEAAGRAVPAHGARGPGHIAFAASDSELTVWREHLRQTPMIDSTVFSLRIAIPTTPTTMPASDKIGTAIANTSEPNAASAEAFGLVPGGTVEMR